MRKLDEAPVKIAFPCLYWRLGSLFSAEEPRHLYVADRSIHREMQESTDSWHLLDCNGRAYDISSWEEIEPFGGLSTWFERLTGKIFAVPVLINEHELSLASVRETLLCVAEDRFKYDIESYALQDIQDELPHAKTCLEAIRIVSKRA